MTAVTKAIATIEAVPETEASDPNGEFDVILSAQTLDRDGDTLRSDEWKTPLPDHITFDVDHGMSVASTVGSGRPFINDAGDLQVRGTFSGIPRAQEVRQLVREGHIRTTSVAFMVDKTHKDAAPRRELLNGAFVAIPSNREAVILSAKSGARNSAKDGAAIQAVHDHAVSLGADCGSGEQDGANKSAPAAVTKTAVLDEVGTLLADVDITSLPPAVARALELLRAANGPQDVPAVTGDGSTTDGGLPAETSTDTPPSGSAPASAAAAPGDAESDAVEAAALELVGRALELQVELMELDFPDSP